MFNLNDIVKVLLPIAVGNGYDYRLTAPAKVGTFVRVTVMNRPLVGVVVGVGDSGLPESKIKNAEPVCEPAHCSPPPPARDEKQWMLSSADIEWIKKMSQWTMMPTGMVLRLILNVPEAFLPQKTEQLYTYSPPDKFRMTDQRQAVADSFASNDNEPMTIFDVQNIARVSPAVVRTMIKNGVLVPSGEVVRKTEIIKYYDTGSVVLNEEQQAAAGAIMGMVEPPPAAQRGASAPPLEGGESCLRSGAQLLGSDTPVLDSPPSRGGALAPLCAAGGGSTTNDGLVTKPEHHQRKYTEQAFSFSKELKQNLTEHERLLWYYLKGGKFDSFSFRKQQPIGKYIVDFINIETKLVLELDGAHHGEEKQIVHDAQRDKWLQNEGYRILRFWNSDVSRKIDMVLSTIAYYLENKTENPPLQDFYSQIVPPQGGGMYRAQILSSDTSARDCSPLKEWHFQVFLLDGITGSGKTQVYFDAALRVYNAGRAVLLMMPEIALTAQFMSRFENRFGAKPIVWHSNLTAAKRRDIWRGVANGDIKIIIGTRSALFLPWRDLGLIVVDEEHDGSYKQEDMGNYHARDMAILRAKISDFPVILASATPAAETLRNAQSGKYKHLRLTSRFGGAQLPVIEAIDMRADKPDNY